MDNLIEKLVIELVSQDINNERDFLKLKRRFSRESKVQFFTSDELLRAYHNLIANKTISRSKELERMLTLKSTRSDSGIVVVSLLTKPYPCPGKCLYCPSQADVPKSYLSNEPAVMRAIMCKYDPFLQTISRLKALDAVGHATDKVNIRIIGGTWSAYEKRYQTWFIKRIFEAANELSHDTGSLQGDSSHYACQLRGTQSVHQDDRTRTLEVLQSINETAKHRIVEISVETRQDYIDEKEIKRLRMLGVTKVELGVQSIYDDVLEFNKRGNKDIDTINATKLLKDAGFKVSYQMMANLPGSDLKKDEEMFKELFNNPNYKPDHMKIYPMALVKESGAYQIYKEGKYKPYAKDELVLLLKKIKSRIPYYCRIERVIRDIPANSIVEGGAKVSNMRQIVLSEMENEELKCNCIRCREVKSSFDIDEKYRVFREDYEASGGHEVFLSIENEERSKLYCMIRLRINSKKMNNIGVLNNAAIIREIHTYGPQVRIGGRNDNAAQHQGFGKMLIREAEKISKDEFRVKKIAVIAGVGVRGYFRKLGYELIDSYMVKGLS